ncbi:MAG: hypothetical protein ACJ8E7_07600, partial [Sphingomicrobium sp.]
MMSKAPVYREAYPRINLIEAEIAISAGRTVCLFRDQLGRVTGQATLDDISDDRALLVHVV